MPGEPSICLLLGIFRSRIDKPMLRRTEVWLALPERTMACVVVTGNLSKAWDMVAALHDLSVWCCPGSVQDKMFIS